MSEKWTTEDIATALLQGWNVYDIWDERKSRSEFEIQRDVTSNIFLTDEDARLFVYDRAHKGDPLATKASRLVFKSKVGDIDDVVKRRRRA